MNKLYLKGWEFNTYQIINEIRKQVEKMGGELVQDFPYILKNEKIMIFNRYYLEAERETKWNLEKSPKLEEYNKKYYKDYYEAIRRGYKYKKIVKNKNYLNFYLNGFIYYVELNENPFFEHYILKERAEKSQGGYIVKFSHYMEKLELPTFSWYGYINEKNIKKIAKKLFRTILDHKECEIIKTKKRVYNIYNSGTHLETVCEERNKKYVKMEG